MRAPGLPQTGTSLARETVVKNDMYPFASPKENVLLQFSFVMNARGRFSTRVASLAHEADKNDKCLRPFPRTPRRFPKEVPRGQQEGLKRAPRGPGSNFSVAASWGARFFGRRKESAGLPQGCRNNQLPARRAAWSQLRRPSRPPRKQPGRH